MYDKSYPMVWEPLFSPVDNTITAPVKSDGKWTLAKDGQKFWDGKYEQLWHHQYSSDGKNIAAIVAPSYGNWTVAVNDNPWKHTFNESVTDLVFSPDGKSAACLGKSQNKWRVCVNGKPWSSSYDMAWKPVFSPDGNHVASKVEQNGSYMILLNETSIGGNFDYLCNPVFSPDGSKLLIKGIIDNKYYRQVINLPR